MLNTLLLQLYNAPEVVHSLLKTLKCTSAILRKTELTYGGVQPQGMKNLSPMHIYVLSTLPFQFLETSGWQLSQIGLLVRVNI